LLRELREVIAPHARHRETRPLVLAAQAYCRPLLGYRLPDGRPQHEGHTHQQEEARQVLGSAKLRPLQLDAKPAALIIIHKSQKRL
jgi:hypothetical protein